MNPLTAAACYQSSAFITEYCDRRDVITIVISFHCHSTISPSEREELCWKGKTAQHEMNMKSFS